MPRPCWSRLNPFAPRDPEVAVVRLKGPIGDLGSFRQGLNIERFDGVLKAAFASRRTTAVALVINSPGGSPVQSDLIKTRIEALSREHEKPVTAFTEDLCASGGYWIAQAADEIIAHPSSVVGSIGVITAGFGLQEAIGKLGIERRVHTKGAAKGMLDPFQAEKPEEVARLEALQQDLYEGFKEVVRRRRGTKLKGEEDELFSGAVWTGTKALELGIVDGLGDLRTVMRERYGEDVRFRRYGPRLSFWQKLRRGNVAAENAEGAPSLMHGLIAAVEERLLWNRFGL
ncbi:S49 family peptidase [Nisaea acidiphila]|uniref:S49 family peptidase n=1 Tax=Nisaea acidiphila TaxID=1862145 RepID=A0A9J7AXG8_9PROT|nr:S49 family peptidase [Nisaea acidiphila]UUX51129.1 S49 family peptidase [Nisaea acidiphila]